jgi:hypothetical protein
VGAAAVESVARNNRKIEGDLRGMNGKVGTVRRRSQAGE